MEGKEEGRVTPSRGHKKEEAWDTRNAQRVCTTMKRGHTQVPGIQTLHHPSPSPSDSMTEGREYGQVAVGARMGSTQLEQNEDETSTEGGRGKIEKRD